MKFIVSSTALSSHLQAISRVINSKNALPIWIVSSLNCKTEPCLQLFPTVKRRWSLRSK